MTDKRHNFSERTKNDLALRACYLCSICKRPTVGPSDESPNAVTKIGVAAHITAAASGSTARRYDPSMTKEQRISIDNGIWLCSSCGTLIDRDEARYTVEHLHDLKRQHEASRRILGGSEVEEDIIAIGPKVILLGALIRSAPDECKFRISHFLEGNVRDLWALTMDGGKN